MIWIMWWKQCRKPAHQIDGLFRCFCGRHLVLVMTGGDGKFCCFIATLSEHVRTCPPFHPDHPGISSRSLCWGNDAANFRSWIGGLAQDPNPSRSILQKWLQAISTCALWALLVTKIGSEPLNPTFWVFLSMLGKHDDTPIHMDHGIWKLAYHPMPRFALLQSKKMLLLYGCGSRSWCPAVHPK